MTPRQEIQNRSYRKHRVKRRAEAVAVSVRKYREWRAFVDWLKAQPCADCASMLPPECMDFDHREPATKRFCIASSHTRNAAIFQAEVMKCDLICSNCHRIRTRLRRKATRH